MPEGELADGQLFGWIDRYKILSVSKMSFF